MVLRAEEGRPQQPDAEDAEVLAEDAEKKKSSW
jgi:hypothetical protein